MKFFCVWEWEGGGTTLGGGRAPWGGGGGQRGKGPPLDPRRHEESNRELAERLVITENTVKYHFRNILDKLHVQNRAQVVAFAVRHGMVEPPE